jgi:hypothetical protein
MKGCWISIVVGGSCLATASAAPEPKPDAGSICLYQSEAFSEGAFVCVQKSLMLTCVVEGAHASWKPVPNKDINDRCKAPIAQHLAPAPRIHSHSYRYGGRLRHSLVQSQAKCFIFNGVEYCE